MSLIKDLKIVKLGTPKRTKAQIASGIKAGPLYGVTVLDQVGHTLVYNADKEDLQFMMDSCRMALGVEEPVAEALARMQKRHEEDQAEIHRYRQHVTELEGRLADSTILEELDTQAPVQSVAGKQGHVALHANDIMGLAAVAISGNYSDLVHRPVPARQWRDNEGQPLCKVGDRVWHAKRGFGTVTDIKSCGVHSQVQVAFDGQSNANAVWLLRNVSGLKFEHEAPPESNLRIQTQNDADTLTFDEDEGPTIVSTHLHYAFQEETLVTGFMVRTLGTVIANNTEHAHFVDVQVKATGADGQPVEEIIRMYAPEADEIIEKCVRESNPYKIVTAMVQER